MIVLTKLSDVQSAIEPLGFEVTTRLVAGKEAATYSPLPRAIAISQFNPAQQRFWQPLFDWRIKNKLSLLALKRETGITGLL
jgi:hypothetical protein